MKAFIFFVSYLLFFSASINSQNLSGTALMAFGNARISYKSHSAALNNSSMSGLIGTNHLSFVYRSIYDDVYHSAILLAFRPHGNHFIVVSVQELSAHSDAPVFLDYGDTSEGTYTFFSRNISLGYCHKIFDSMSIAVDVLYFEERFWIITKRKQIYRASLTFEYNNTLAAVMLSSPLTRLSEKETVHITAGLSQRYGKHAVLTEATLFGDDDYAFSFGYAFSPFEAVSLISGMELRKSPFQSTRLSPTCGARLEVKGLVFEYAFHYNNDFFTHHQYGIGIDF